MIGVTKGDTRSLDYSSYRDNGKENVNYYDVIRVILGLYRDNGKEDGNYYNVIGVILGLYRDNGKEDGNYYNVKELYWGYIGIMEKNMETTIM